MPLGVNETADDCMVDCSESIAAFCQHQIIPLSDICGLKAHRHLLQRVHRAPGELARKIGLIEVASLHAKRTARSDYPTI